MKKFFAILLCLFPIFVISCNNKSESEEKLIIKEWRIDKGPIENRFPIFKKQKKIIWKGGSFGENSIFSVIGPSGYWIRGYIFLFDDFIMPGSINKEWVPVNLNIENGYKLKEVDTGSIVWQFNKQFNDKLLGSKYSGNFYYNFDSKLIYFDVFWE